MLSSSCVQSTFFQCLPCSLCWGGGRTSKAVQWRDQKPHLVTGGGMMSWWYWQQRGKVFFCLSTILIPTHSSRNSQSLLFSIIKGARNFLLLQSFHLYKTVSPWVSILGGLISEECWHLSCDICQPLSSHVPVLQKAFGREGRRMSLCLVIFTGVQCWGKWVYGMNWQLVPSCRQVSQNSGSLIKANMNAEVRIELHHNTE